MNLIPLTLVLLIATTLVDGVPKKCKKTSLSQDITEPKRPRCLRYGQRCEREGTWDRCCLQKGGICRYVNGHGVICALPVKGNERADPSFRTFDWNVFWREHWIKHPGWVGGAFFKTGETRGRSSNAQGPGADVDGIEIQSILPFVAYGAECQNTFILGSKSYTCKPELKDKEINVGYGSRYKVFIWATKTGIVLAFHDKHVVSDADAIILADYWKRRLSYFGF